MFCEKCGSEIPDIARFCPKCGAPVQEPAAKPDETKETSAGSQEVPDESKEMTAGSQETPAGAQEKPHKKRGRRILITLIIIAAAVAVLLLLFFRFDLAGRIAGEKTVDLDDYITVEFDGYDGYGIADVTFDIDALGDDYDGEIRLSRDAGESYRSFSEVIADMTDIIVEPDTGLSDGDEVTVTWEVDSEAIESLTRGNVEILNARIEYTVSDLGEAETFDAFADVTVEFSGTSPDAAASLVVGEGYLSEDAYSLSEDSDLQIGETVTVSIDEEAAAALEAEQGRFPEEMSRDYTVEGIDYAVTSLDQIPEEAMDSMKETAEQVKEEKAASWDPERYTMESMDYVGSYLLSKKPGSDADDLDKIYLIYKLHVIMYGKNADGSDANVEFDYYWYGGFHNGIMKADGTFSIDYEDMSQPVYSPDSEITEGVIVTAYDYTKNNVDEQENTEIFDGYEDINSMFESLVVPKEDNYSCESTVPE